MTDTVIEKEVEVEQTNFMGHASYTLADPVHRLRVAAASCLFGEPQYYRESSKHTESRINSAVTSAQLSHFMDILAGKVEMAPITGETPSTYMERLIDEALDHDVEATLLLAADLRNKDHIRTTPQAILVRAANHKNAKGTGLIRKYAVDILSRADEPAVQLAYQLDKFGKTVPNSLKKAWRDCLEDTSEFHLAKYRMEGRKVKTIDVVRFAHANSPAIDKLVKDELKLGDTNETWESYISKNGSLKESWEHVIDQLWIEVK